MPDVTPAAHPTTRASLALVALASVFGAASSPADASLLTGEAASVDPAGAADPGEPAATTGGSSVVIRTAGAPTVPKKGNWAPQPALESSLLEHVNRVRAARGIRHVLPSPVLRHPARAHSRFLALVRRGTLAHRDAEGRPFYHRLIRAGWRANARMSENLASINACRARDPRLIVNRWMGSPHHRANLLDARVTHIGIGAISTAGCRTTVYTANFAN